MASECLKLQLTDSRDMETLQLSGIKMNVKRGRGQCLINWHIVPKSSNKEPQTGFEW